MKRIKKSYAILIILVSCTIILTAISLFIIFTPRQRTTKSDKYELDCLTKPVKRPLKECRQ